ncbi:uncharacterized protein [Clytia hemisphaerica]|uniref:uncharacterized protein n=1 Tax=Clytia hemisphaerica TaxID=252671 RepID=UPI0034D4777D
MPTVPMIRQIPSKLQSNSVPIINNFAFFKVQGLCPQTVPSKVPFIENNICHKSLLFVGLSETWLNNHKDAEIKVGYTLFKCDSSRKKKSRGRATGGVCFYIRDDIAASREIIYSLKSPSVQLLCVYSKPENLAMLVIYRQPDDKSNRNPSTAKDLLTPLKGAKQALSALESVPNIIFGGDFNLPKSTWPDGLKLDALCVTKHFTSQYCYGINRLKVQNFASDDDKPEPRSKFNALNFFSDEIDWNKLKEDLNQIDWDVKLKSDDPQEILESINQICLDVCRGRIPVRTTKDTRKKSKVERYRRSLTKRRRKITKQFLKCMSQSKKTKITKELLTIEKDLQKSFRDSKCYVENIAINSIKKNSKYFFAYARKKAKIKTKIGPLLNTNGELTQRSKEMAEILSRQYVSVFRASKPFDIMQSENDDVNVDIISDLQVTEDDLIKAINDLSQTAASGPDGFPAIFLKQCKEELSIPLCILWRQSLDKGIVPDGLKRCTITPIYKGGSRSLHQIIDQ